MSLPTAETQCRVACQAAQGFVSQYYGALRKRAGLKGLYVSASAKLVEAAVKADISINGKVCDTVAEYEALLKTQGQPVAYEVHGFDGHPVNPHYIVGAPNTTMSREGDKLSVAVQVSGVVRYGKGESAMKRSFNEAFVLVPHWEAQAKKRGTRHLPRWLILSQNLRVL